MPSPPGRQLGGVSGPESVSLRDPASFDEDVASFAPPSPLSRLIPPPQLAESQRAEVTMARTAQCEAGDGRIATRPPDQNTAMRQARQAASASTKAPNGATPWT